MQHKERISHPDMVRALIKPGKDICDEFTPEKANILHMAVGLCGEVSELLEALVNLRNFENEYPTYANNKDGNKEAKEKHKEIFDNIIEELGDIEFYMEGIKQHFSIETSGVSNSVDSLENYVNKVLISSGTFLDMIKKFAIYNKPLPKQMDDFYAIIYKMDIYLNRVRVQLGVTQKDALDNNIEKLSKRYEGFKYSNEAAINRADKQ